MKLFICFLALFFTINSNSSTGLKTSVYLHGFMFETVPVKRQAIRNSLQVKSFKQKQLNSLRVRLNPRLDNLKAHFLEYKSKIGMSTYNPFFKEVYVTKENIKYLNKNDYPLNIKYKINTSNISTEFIHITLKKKVTPEELLAYLDKMQDLLLVKVTPLPEKKNKGRSLTIDEKEMLERLKLKKIEFQSIEKFFAINMTKNVIVDMQFYRDFREVIGSEFAKILSEFRDQFYHDQAVSKAKSASLLKNLPEIIQGLTLKHDSDVFFVSSSKIPKIIQRTTQDHYEYKVSMISAMDKKYFKEIKKVFIGILREFKAK